MMLGDCAHRQEGKELTGQLAKLGQRRREALKDNFNNIANLTEIVETFKTSLIYKIDNLNYVYLKKAKLNKKQCFTMGLER